MKIERLIVTSAFVASFAFGASSFAADNDQFTLLDADGNGVITPEEAAANPMLRQDWAAADVNKDGQLERAEFSALEQKSKPEMIK